MGQKIGAKSHFKPPQQPAHSCATHALAHLRMHDCGCQCRGLTHRVVQGERNMTRHVFMAPSAHTHTLTLEKQRSRRAPHTFILAVLRVSVSLSG